MIRKLLVMRIVGGDENSLVGCDENHILKVVELLGNSGIMTKWYMEEVPHVVSLLVAVYF